MVEREWLGDHPFYLLIVRDHQPHFVDLDEQGWAQKHAELMRGAKDTWHLVRKNGVVVFSMIVRDGEQPYYTARHLGVASIGRDGVTQNEVVAHGIGKKRLDGHVDRLWVLPTAQICAGDDVEVFGRQTLAAATVKPMTDEERLAAQRETARLRAIERGETPTE